MILNVVLTEFPTASVAVTVTEVVPIVKMLPLAGTAVTVGVIVQLSVAVGNV